eukprot:366470-Chlamydomonas_euryale.AAC.2
MDAGAAPVQNCTALRSLAVGCSCCCCCSCCSCTDTGPAPVQNRRALLSLAVGCCCCCCTDRGTARVQKSIKLPDTLGVGSTRRCTTASASACQGAGACCGRTSASAGPMAPASGLACGHTPAWPCPGGSACRVTSPAAPASALCKFAGMAAGVASNHGSTSGRLRPSRRPGRGRGGDANASCFGSIGDGAASGRTAAPRRVASAAGGTRTCAALVPRTTSLRRDGASTESGTTLSALCGAPTGSAVRGMLLAHACSCSVGIATEHGAGGACHSGGGGCGTVGRRPFSCWRSARSSLCCGTRCWGGRMAPGLSDSWRTRGLHLGRWHLHLLLHTELRNAIAAGAAAAVAASLQPRGCAAASSPAALQAAVGAGTHCPRLLDAQVGHCPSSACRMRCLHVHCLHVQGSPAALQWVDPMCACQAAAALGALGATGHVAARMRRLRHGPLAAAPRTPHAHAATAALHDRKHRRRHASAPAHAALCRACMPAHVCLRQACTRWPGRRLRRLCAWLARSQLCHMWPSLWMQPACLHSAAPLPGRARRNPAARGHASAVAATDLTSQSPPPPLPFPPFLASPCFPFPPADACAAAALKGAARRAHQVFIAIHHDIAVAEARACSGCHPRWLSHKAKIRGLVCGPTSYLHKQTDRTAEGLGGEREREGLGRRL